MSDQFNLSVALQLRGENGLSRQQRFTTDPQNCAENVWMQVHVDAGESIELTLGSITSPKLVIIFGEPDISITRSTEEMLGSDKISCYPVCALSDFNNIDDDPSPIQITNSGSQTRTALVAAFA